MLNLYSFLHKRPCPVCESTDDSHIILQENIDKSKLNDFSFSSRKMPEFMNFKIVCCPTCDLLYAPTIPSAEFLNSAYQTTDYDSDEEAKFAAKTYAKWIKNIVSFLPDKAAALEIGSGNGAFLHYLLKAGFENVTGIEPSTKAISAAPDHLKTHIEHGMFNVNNFSPNSFSLISIFQTLEHIEQPTQFFADALHLLKPGGALMLVAHNYRHWLMRLLGKKAPIIDIEHLQLFSPKSLEFSLKKIGFKNIQIHSLRNIYPLHYWIKLLPLPVRFKTALLTFLKKGWGHQLGSINIGIQAGNMIAFAYK